jgi:NAD(P)-dependent dehydrogenase (short-subunit alcohol dehydrogenase family)
MARLDGKVAIVTGAGRQGNIGAAVCDAFLREGARAVIATDLRMDAGAELTADMDGKHGAGRYRLVQQDVTLEADWAALVETVLAEFGAIDILVNNAGISIHGGIETTSLEDLRKVMAVNHDSGFLGMKYCAPALAETIKRFPGGGSVINTVSMASYMPNANNVGYHVSKSAQRMLTLCGAVEFGPKRIRVNSVHPGQTTTPLLKEGYEEYARLGFYESSEAGIQDLVKMCPLGIESFPEDTAHAFVYLASDESRFVTGASIYHDGGLARHF